MVLGVFFTFFSPPHSACSLLVFNRSRLTTPRLLQTILDYMEKVEVQGLRHSAAQAKMLLERAQREQQYPQTATTAAAAAAGAVDTVLGGGDDHSLGSWDAESLGGMSGAGASVLSLGSLVPPPASATGAGRSR